MMHSTAVAAITQLTASTRRTGAIITPALLTQEHIDIALLVYEPARESRSLRAILILAGDHLASGITGSPAVAAAAHVINAMLTGC